MATLLIVEDDVLLSRLYQKVFTSEGYQVEMAPDGEAGMVAAKKVKPTLILLDIMMPKLNGLEVLTRLKADPETKNIPVIVLTNLADDKYAEEALQQGAVRYIVKSEHKPKQVEEIVRGIIAGYTRGEIPKT
jgi:CheY-like chemotaxis protein